MVSGGVYIKKILEDGALKEDFQVELLGVYPLEECLEKEKELAKTSLFPKGLNGNSGACIIQTEEVRKKISDALKGTTHKGIPHSEETKRKISEAKKRYTQI